MSPNRHEKASAIFLKACKLAPEERDAFLEQACAGDAELRAEVESLLAHDGSPMLETGHGLRQAVALLNGDAEQQAPQAMAERRRCPACDFEIPAGLTSCPRCTMLTMDLTVELPSVSVPGYEILGLLGEGGMGKVYLARDTTLGRRVAIKMISEQRSGEQNAALRFLREARTMATVEHPHIVRVYTLGQIDNRSYLVMEYVEGESLDRRIRRQGSLSVDESLRVLAETVDALEAAWEHGIVHRDVKPANILIDTQDKVRVADFGLAKAIRQEGDPSITEVGRGLGTPHYVSPEQARGEADLDFHSDIYSLGIVLFEMLAGEPPFRGTSPLSVIDQHLHTPMPSLRAGRSDVAAQIEQLCEWMTRKQPADRPASYAELRQTVEVLRGNASLAGSVSGSFPTFLVVEEEAPTIAFVGRERHLDVLDTLLDKTLAGDGQVAFVTGEAGTGKSLLVAEFARRALERHEELIVAQGNCNAQTGMGDPYLPFRELLTLLTGDVESRRASGSISVEHARRLWSLLPVAAEVLVRDGSDLIGTFVPGEMLVARAAAFTPSPAGWRVRLEELVRRNAAMPRDANLQQSDLFEQYIRTLQALARQHPLLLEIEDLHWADSGSCSLLFHLGHRIAGDRMLIVGTYRPAEVELERDGQRHPFQSVGNELQRLFGNTSIQVGEEETREFVDALVDSQPNRLSPVFRDSLFRQTQGHPLFTVELLGSMREQNILTKDDDGRWIEGPALDWETLPARVEGAIGERIGRLPENLRKVLSLASVQGEEFKAEVLARAQGTDAREMVSLLSRELDKRHRLVSAQGVRRVEGQRISSYRFRHILFQKYLYAQMDEVERPYLHEEVGATLEALYGDRVDEVAVQLARHFQEADIAEKAIHYLRQAGQTAVGLSANEEALAHFRRGLELVATLPEGPERARSELSLQLALGAPVLATLGPGSTVLRDAYTRAHELCEQVGEAPQLFQTLFLLVHHYCNRGELQQALEFADQLLDISSNADEPLPTIMAHWARGFVLHFAARLDESLEHLERVARLYDPQQHASLAYIYGMDPAVTGLSFNSVSLWYLGRLDRARECSRQALELARRVDHPSSTAHALSMAVALAMYSGDIEALDEHLEALLPLTTEQNVVLFRAWGEFARGWSLVEHGQLENGIGRMQQGIEGFKAVGAPLSLPSMQCGLAKALALAGESEAALTSVSDALAGIERGGERLREAELYRIRGELLLQRSPEKSAAEAESCFLRALAIARSHNLKPFELRATMSFSRLLESTGARKEAHRQLAEIYGRFTEGLDSPALTAAKQLLDRLSQSDSA